MCIIRRKQSKKRVQTHAIFCAVLHRMAGNLGFNILTAIVLPKPDPTKCLAEIVFHKSEISEVITK